MPFKYSCNRKSNQQNLGTIKSSNLCTEIIEFTSPTESAVCNLTSIALPRFVMEKGVPIESHPSKLVGSRGSKNRYFHFDKLAEVTSIVTTNLSKIIDVNYYPVETAKRSNLRHGPIGIGVQDLADAFILLGMPFDSPEAQQLNKDIFETIYYHALKTSTEIAAKEGPYDYKASHVSKVCAASYESRTPGTQVVELLIQKLENEVSYHKGVDLFYLVDSITQCSHSQKDVAPTRCCCPTWS